MPRSQAIRVIAAAAAASLALSFAIAAGQSTPDDPQSQAGSGLGVEWAFRPDNLSQLVNRSQAVVVATVKDVRAGAELVTGAPGDPGSASTVPTQLVDLSLERTITGQVPRRFTIFKLGAEGQQPEGDPAYEVGSRYLLFVSRRDQGDLPGTQPRDTYIATAPDGRLEAVARALDASIAGPVANQLDSETVPEAVREIEAASQGGPQ